MDQRVALCHLEHENSTHPGIARHICFGKSIMKKGHMEVTKRMRYISDVDMIRLRGEDTSPLLEKNEVIAF